MFLKKSQHRKINYFTAKNYQCVHRKNIRGGCISKKLKPQVKHQIAEVRGWINSKVLNKSNRYVGGKDVKEEGKRR